MIKINHYGANATNVNLSNLYKKKINLNSRENA